MKRWFQISSVEEKGFWLLNVVILVLVLNKVFSPFKSEAPVHQKKEGTAQAFLEFVAAQNRLDSIEKAHALAKKRRPIVKRSNDFRNAKKNPKPFVFDPNTASAETLIQLGFRSYQAENLIAYREAGGRFSNPADLKKIYGMYKPLIDSLAPWMRFPAKTKAQKAFSKNTTHRNKKVVDVNTADTTELKSLYGIGGYYAKKIIAYREALGGFVDTLQLLEIWRLDSAIFTKNPGRIVVGKSNLIPVNLNTATRKELAKHPYLSWKQANVIVAYREQHGPYGSLEEITRTVLIDAQDYVKIAPYFTVE